MEKQKYFCWLEETNFDEGWIDCIYRTSLGYTYAESEKKAISNMKYRMGLRDTDSEHGFVSVRKRVKAVLASKVEGKKLIEYEEGR